MSTQTRFDPERVDAFSFKLEAYIRTLEDYEIQITGALARLGETFDDQDYEDLRDEFMQMRVKLTEMLDAARPEVQRMRGISEDVRLSQAESTRR